jgi:LEM3 (ligand-effect modulator 3) family / CDC50 family
MAAPSNTAAVVVSSSHAVPPEEKEDAPLDLAEQTNRPVDNALNQQRINAWHPILDPVWVIVALFYLGIILIPVGTLCLLLVLFGLVDIVMSLSSLMHDARNHVIGFKIDSIQENTVELKQVYDEYSVNYDVNNTLCGIGDNYNENRVCTMSFVAPKDMVPPILIHYELTNFHQNHRAYYKSRDPYQLLGQVEGQSSIDAEACNPLNKLGNITINPCGLTANTFFNDDFELLSGNDAYGVPLVMREDGIAWQSDVDFAFAQPEGFEYSNCTVCDASCCNATDSCIDGLPYKDPATGMCYRYYYPLDDTTQYLYETYPNVISPIEGVTNEHFIVWMRIATQPNFRKLYGWIDQPILKGEELTFSVASNFVVTRFKGSKALVVSTTSIFGGRNPYLGPVFIWVGVFCLVAGTFFTLKHTLRPRKLADPAYLRFKEE